MARTDELILDAAQNFEISRRWEAFCCGAIRPLLHNKLVLRIREIRAAMETCTPDQLVRHQASIQEVKKLLELLNTKEILPIATEVQKQIRLINEDKN